MSNNPMAIAVVAAVLSGALAWGSAVWVFDSGTSNAASKDLVSAQGQLRDSLWQLSSKVAQDEGKIADQGAREDELNRIVAKISDDIASTRTSIAVIQSDLARVLPPPDGLKKR